jgi:predicted nucleotidyltransferase
MTLASMKSRIGGSSGRFVLRLPPALHSALQAAARAGGLSLNEYCVRRLAAGATGLATDPGAATLVAHASAIAADALVGVVLHGSWTRGEATAASDVDVLIVVDARISLGRALYHAWDEQPAAWQDRPVDASFAHLPHEPVTGGLWPEIAVNGLVLFERNWEISAQLVRIRQAIADGRLVRRVAHGQPYWTTMAEPLRACSTSEAEPR